jgi:hypothetical protein
MAKLFSYCVLYDNGAAPNPFWDVCTLAICKPIIRRSAQPGDWIVGTGSKGYGFENKVVYAMEVTDVKTFDEYDEYCKRYLQGKIPDVESSDLKRIVGDCIYDFSAGEKPSMRPGVHTEENRDRDLGGKNVLLSTNFYYFGSKPVPLPGHLLKLVRQGQGHKSNANDTYIVSFIEWIQTFKRSHNKVAAMPYGLAALKSKEERANCSRNNLALAAEDEIIGVSEC